MFYMAVELRYVIPRPEAAFEWLIGLGLKGR
jgi:hypothetical protein